MNLRTRLRNKTNREIRVWPTRPIDGNSCSGCLGTAVHTVQLRNQILRLCEECSTELCTQLRRLP